MARLTRRHFQLAIALTWLVALVMAAIGDSSRAQAFGGVMGLPRASPSVHSTTEPSTGTRFSPLPIGIPVWTQNMATYFDGLRAMDVAALFQDNAPAPVPPFSSITHGHLAAAYTAWADGQAALPTIPTSVSWVLYDPEEWAYTPPSEQNNLVATAAAASAAVHASGRKFLLTPSAGYSSLYAAQLAPYADRYDIQAERYQTNTTEFASFVGGLYQAIKAANPTCQVWVEVSVNKYAPSVAYDALRALPMTPDGIAIYAAGDQDLPPLEQLITWLRPTGW